MGEKVVAEEKGDIHIVVNHGAGGAGGDFRLDMCGEGRRPKITLLGVPLLIKNDAPENDAFADKEVI